MHLLLSVVILGPPVVGVREDVVNVHDAALQNGSSRRRSSILTDRITLHDLDEFRRVAIAGRNAINLPILPVDEALVGATESDRVPEQVLQHWLEIESRAADYLEDFVGRRLLLQRLGELPFQVNNAGIMRFCLRPGRTKTGNACSALRSFARQGHLVGTVIGPLPVRRSPV